MSMLPLSFAEDDLPLTSLDALDSSPEGMSENEYLLHQALLDDALFSIQGEPASSGALPNYYDDKLMQLIDAVPLEE